jgi:hypothetical protein
MNRRTINEIIVQLSYRYMCFFSFYLVSAYLQNVHKIYKMRCLVLHNEKNHQSLKEYLTTVRNVPITDFVIVTARMAFILDKIHNMDLTIGRFGNDNVLINPDTNKVKHLYTKHLILINICYK